MTTPNHSEAAQYPQYRSLRIAAIAVGSVLIALSLGAWFPYLGASLEGLGKPESDHGVTNADIVAALFTVWLFVWFPGIALAIAGTAGWRKRATWGFVALAVVMLAATGTTYIVGSSTG